MGGSVCNEETTIGAVDNPATESILASKDFGNLAIIVNKLRIDKDGFVAIDFTFQNKSTKNAVAIAFYHDPCFVRPCSLRTTLTAANGTKFSGHSDDLQGIQSMRFGVETLTEIEPGGSIQRTAPSHH